MPRTIEMLTCPHCQWHFLARGCHNCRNFYLHYTRNDDTGAYTATQDGHCVKPRIKPRRAGTPACEHWEVKL